MIPPARCAALLPDNWQAGVEATPVPANIDLRELIGRPLTEAVAAAIAAPWAAAYVGMSGQLEKANGRTADAMTIYQRCEAQVNAARPENQ